jgi:hypothetical protein
MKFVKVTALAAAMMATFGAQAELAAMDDAALEAVTGQVGITIDMSAVSDIDIAYVDSDGGGGAATEGALMIENIAVGANTITIDVNGDKELVVGTTAALSMSMDLGLTGTFTNFAAAAADSGGLGTVFMDVAAGNTFTISAH